MLFLKFTTFDCSAIENFNQNQYKMSLSDNTKKELLNILPDTDILEHVYSIKEDFCAITNKRVVFVDKNIGSARKTLTSVPLAKINFVALKRGGLLTINKEVVISSGGINLVLETWDEDLAYEIVREISKRIQ